MKRSGVTISVVVPTYRRPDLLLRCLQALCGQAFARRDYEIIVADDDGQDPAVRAVVERIARTTAGAPLIRYLPVLR